MTAFVGADAFDKAEILETFEVFFYGGQRYFQLLSEHFSCYRRLNYDGIEDGGDCLSKLNGAIFQDTPFLGTFGSFLGTFGGECQGQGQGGPLGGRR